MTFVLEGGNANGGLRDTLLDKYLLLRMADVCQPST